MVATGRNEVKTVVQTFTSNHEKAVKVGQSNGQVITSSYGHPYYTQRGWIAAESLKVGDILQTVNGEKVIVEFVQHEILETPTTLYNFEVDGNHNYYVAESVFVNANDFVLVHNDCDKNGYKLNKNAKEVLEMYDNNNWDKLPGYAKPHVYKNNTIPKLPDNTIYKTYDVVPKVSGIGRNAERFVRGQNGTLGIRLIIIKLGLR